MKTVWLLISPVVLFMNSAVTNSGRRVGDVALLALLDRVLRRLEPVVAERQRHRPREVLDRGDLLEDLLEAGGWSGRRRGRPSGPARPGPARCRCRAASRSCRSAGRGGSGPRGARGSSRRRCAGALYCWCRSCCGWACWRCARRPRGVLPRAAGLSACAHAGPPGANTLGQVRWQRKATAYPLGTPTSSGPPVPSRARGRQCSCHGASRMDPRSAPVKDQAASQRHNLAHQPLAVDPVQASAGPG